MARFFIVITIVLINFILQTTWPMQIFGISPNTAIIIVVSFAILRHEVEGAMIGFFAGLLQDVFFGVIIGLNAFLYMLIGFFSGKPFKEFYVENYLLPIALIGITTFLFNFAYYLLNFLFRARLDIFSYVWSIILPSTLYNIAITLPIYVFIYRINSRLESHEKHSRKIFNR
ncbi:MAG: rod shape-determining protein MreD [Defluviitaleaceae bacterium]|nr:rod shape-determining protein MreD [Defluviitaleaceae bacterium]